MKAEDDLMFISSKDEHTRAKQRVIAQIEAVILLCLPVFGDARLVLGGAHRNRKRALLQNHLKRTLRLLVQERRTKDVVTLEEIVPRTRKVGKIQWPAYPIADLFEIRP